jgi:hypothetical protein
MPATGLYKPDLEKILALSPQLRFPRSRGLIALAHLPQSGFRSGMGQDQQGGSLLDYGMLLLFFRRSYQQGYALGAAY